MVAVRSLDNKDRWFVKVDPASGKATVLDGLHDEAWIREQAVGTVPGLGGGAGIAWLPDSKRFLFLSEKEGYLHLYSLDATAAAPPARALTSGKWEVTAAQLSNDRKAIFVTTNEVHPGERQFYTMSELAERAPLHRIAMIVSPDKKALVIYSYSTKPPEP